MAAVDENTLSIGCGPAEEAAAHAEVVGFKAHNLWRIARLGLPVPPAFVLGIEYCHEYFRRGCTAPDGLRDLLAAKIRHVEQASGLVFGGARKPLLVSVRSGAPVSMPGMLETILDVGLNDQTLRGLVRLTGNPRGAWDSYRRLVQSFAEIVHRCPAGEFEAVCAEHLRLCGLEQVSEMDFQQLATLTKAYQDLFEDRTGGAFPQNPIEQLEAAVVAVWESWSSDKAVEYRRLNDLPDHLGTAVTVQRMVFGNAGGASGAGVGFTRDPATGENRLYLDFVFNVQGEDVVSGRVDAADTALLVDALPETYKEIVKVARTLENEFRDLQEFEYTVENGHLFILQTRSGKRTPWAALRIATELVAEGIIDSGEALERLSAIDLERIQRTRIESVDDQRVLCQATAASCGVASGCIALDSDSAQSMAKQGRQAILVRETTSTADIAGIAAAAGLLTAVGGRTSHAAVIARQMNKVCLVCCDALSIDLDHRRCSIGDQVFNEGAVISLDGDSGQVISGEAQVVVEKPLAWLAEIAGWRREELSASPRGSR
jgi:pyruvate, orthophosphate dikinase